MQIAVVGQDEARAQGLVPRLVSEGHGVGVVGSDALDATTATRLVEAIGDVQAVVYVGDGTAAPLVVDAAQLGGILPFVLVCDDPKAADVANRSALEVTVVHPGTGAADDVSAALG